MKTPYEFQRTAIELIRERNALINDKCGLGKTLTAIWGLEAFVTEGERPTSSRGPHLVVCIKNSRVQWAREVNETLNGFLRAFILDTDGSVLDENLTKIGDIQEGGLIPGVIITHYENLLKWGAKLREVKWISIVADEAHKIKNRKAKRTKFLKMLQADRKIALTATPMEKRPSDYWSIINWLYPKHFTSYWDFSSRFEEHEAPTAWHPYPQFVGPRNMDELAREIGPFTLARTKEEVAPQLPPKIVQELPLELTYQQRRLYNQIAMSKDIEVHLDDFERDKIDPTQQDWMLVKNVLSKIIRLQQISADPQLLGYKIDSCKLQWLDEFIMNNPDEPVVVFSKFRDVAMRIASKYKAPLIVGGIKNPTMRAAEFITGKKDIIVGTIGAMGIAIEGLQRASTAIFMEQEWSTIAMEQAQDRIHRINITDPKNIIFLYGENTVDRLVLNALEQKWTDRELVRQYIREWSDG